MLDIRADYDDNYFDMDAGTQRTVAIDLIEPDALEDAALYIEGENVKRIVLPLANVRERGARRD